MHRTTVYLTRDRQGREYHRCLAAGTLAHCAAAARRYGPGAEIATVGGQRLASLYADRGQVMAVQISADEAGAAVASALSA